MGCLDTTVLLDLLGRGGRRALRQTRALLEQLELEGEDRTTTCFNVAELYVGVYRSRYADREEQLVQDLLTGVTVLEFDDRAALIFGQLTAHLQNLGRPARDMDVLIAAVAITNGQMLVTRNPRHFADMPGLEVRSY